MLHSVSIHSVAASVSAALSVFTYSSLVWGVIHRQMAHSGGSRATNQHTTWQVQGKCRIRERKSDNTLGKHPVRIYIIMIPKLSSSHSLNLRLTVCCLGLNWICLWGCAWFCSSSCMYWYLTVLNLAFYYTALIIERLKLWNIPTVIHTNQIQTFQW